MNATARNALLLAKDILERNPGKGLMISPSVVGILVDGVVKVGPYEPNGTDPQLFSAWDGTSPASYFGHTYALITLAPGARDKPFTLTELLDAYAELLLANPGKALIIGGDIAAVLIKSDKGQQVYGCHIENGAVDISYDNGFELGDFDDEDGRWLDESREQTELSVSKPVFIPMLDESARAVIECENDALKLQCLNASLPLSWHSETDADPIEFIIGHGPNGDIELLRFTLEALIDQAMALKDAGVDGKLTKQEDIDSAKAMSARLRRLADGIDARL